MKSDSSSVIFAIDMMIAISNSQQQIRREVRKALNGYVSAPEILEGMDTFIVSPGLGDNAGLCGALALGIKAIQSRG